MIDNISTINIYINDNEHETNVVIHRNSILEILTYLKLSSVWNINYAIDLIVLDCIENEFRFTLIYIMQTFTGNNTIKIISKTNESLSIESSEIIFYAFSWSEREAYDMFGIFFINNKDLRRLLTDYGFSGHPLKKDFPLSGNKELNYSDSVKLVLYNKIELFQNFRQLNIIPSWKIN